MKCTGNRAARRQDRNTSRAVLRGSMVLRFALLTALTGIGAFAQTFPGAAEVDSAINQAIREDKLPGAVILVGHDGNIVYRKAYGERAQLPVREVMTPDTIFDIASLTKIVATTSAMMKLYDEGRFAPDDLVTKYLPEFQGGRSPITIRDLMTHYSGLRPDLDLDPVWSGYDTGIHRALVDKPANPPETKFVYSDINFELVGEIVRRLSGLPENEYVQQNIFTPLGMTDTGYLPARACVPELRPPNNKKMAKSFGEWFTTPRRASWEVSPGTPEYSLQPMTLQDIVR